MREQVLWTNLTLGEIAQHLAQRGTAVSVTVVTQLLDEAGYVKRQAQSARPSSIIRGAVAVRHLAQIRRRYEDSKNPIASMDTKKKELVGNFYRDGKLYTLKELHTLDHDFPSAATGVIIPHGLYDVKGNRGHINLGVSHDTSQFACDSLKRWWQSEGSDYPEAESLLLLCDGGGSNAASRYVFKAALQELVNEIGLEVQVGHYPPACSKYNPIEHRLFPHVTRACQGDLCFSRVSQGTDRANQDEDGLDSHCGYHFGNYPTGAKRRRDSKRT